MCFTCISMKQKVIYPSTAVSLYLSFPHSLSVSQPVKQTLISLPGKVTQTVVQLFQSLSSRFHLYQEKALTPHTAAVSWLSACEPYLANIESSVCLCVCLSELARVCVCVRVCM